MKSLVYSGALAVLVATFGCSKKNEFQPPPPPEVTVQNPIQKDATVYVGYPGRLDASEEVDIRARVKGYLKAIEFSDGQRVSKGDLLFTIEPEEYEASVKAAEAQLQEAEANQKLANATLKKMNQAYEKEAVSEMDVLKAEADVQGADGAVMGADAALEKARLDLSYTEIRAPLSGRTARHTLSVGNLVGDGGSTLLTTVVAEAPIHAYFNLDERALLPYLNKGVRKDKVGESLPPVKLQLADGTIIDEEGRVDYIDPELDPDTGTLQARAMFENKALNLLPGLYAKVLIPDPRKNAILVPDLAIQRDMNGSFVLVVNAENKVESRYITRGPLAEGKRIVDEGLTAQDRIIVEGLQRARPGITVRIAEAKSDEPSAAPAAE